MKPADARPPANFQPLLGRALRRAHDESKYLAGSLTPVSFTTIIPECSTRHS